MCKMSVTKNILHILGIDQYAFVIIQIDCTIWKFALHNWQKEVLTGFQQGIYWH